MNRQRTSSHVCVKRNTSDVLRRGRLDTASPRLHLLHPHACHAKCPGRGRWPCPHPSHPPHASGSNHCMSSLSLQLRHCLLILRFHFINFVRGSRRGLGLCRCSETKLQKEDHSREHREGKDIKTKIRASLHKNVVS